MNSRLTSHATGTRQANRPPVRAILWRWRWVGVALVCAVIVQTSLSSLAAAEVETHSMVIANKDIYAGQLITEGDVTTIETATDIPGTFSHTEEVVGQHLIAPLSADSPILASHILTDTLVQSARPGHVIAAVPIADTGGLSLLSVGARIDLYAPAPKYAEPGQPNTEAELVASDIVIVGLSTEEGQSTFLSEIPDKTVYFLEIPDSEASLILGIGASTPLIAVLSSTAS
ncbi:MAG: hypothetical protein GX483_07490 [Actinomycetaceae bacterium]|nr:hypothetical protein [Actinomycetaceae bacterium]